MCVYNMYRYTESLNNLQQIMHSTTGGQPEITSSYFILFFMYLYNILYQGRLWFFS